MNDAIIQQTHEIFQQSSRPVFATLVRMLGDFDLAEDALQEAFVAALGSWPDKGIPENPTAWLVSAGRFHAIDRLRRQVKLGNKEAEIAQRLRSIAERNETNRGQAIEDDRLRLIFACCHPAIDPVIQVPLTLREVCGLTTDEIASAFLVQPQTMAQRLVRGKAKIRAAKIPIELPELDDMPERLDRVLSVIYLIFNEGYMASRGLVPIRADLCGEAIRLGRLLSAMLDDSEVRGLLALMLLHESRRAARLDSAGDWILLEDQDRSLWDQQLIGEGIQLIESSLRSGRFGSYTLQAAISAVHAQAATAAQTDWPQIVALYDLLIRVSPGPVVELNRAVAIAMRDGPAAGLQLIEDIFSRGDLVQYSLAHSARGELLRRAGQLESARQAFRQALALSDQAAEQRFLAKKLELLGS